MNWHFGSSCDVKHKDGDPVLEEADQVLHVVQVARDTPEVHVHDNGQTAAVVHMRFEELLVPVPGVHEEAVPVRGSTVRAANPTDKDHVMPVQIEPKLKLALILEETSVENKRHDAIARLPLLRFEAE
eukprot:CAMPEP_0171238596 /NCGR_PEP_ID=MMETSP0790-20130122/43553_1 /TAXON_ID=2925 /ORGANISM="Alexandrium catenella, Strain OF101" /LENGTH=127 /DNA_ID=CAMNT_0011704963 /DNA_START=75 /DNA_END=458 /DNA_ORIENTATION=+